MIRHVLEGAESMIKIEDYTDEEWHEVLERCKMMTQSHEWQPGDWAYCHKNLNRPILLGVWCAPNYICVLNWKVTQYRYGRYDDAIWFPLLHQLVRMDGWKPDWRIGKVFGGQRWGVLVESNIVGGMQSPCDAPTPELAAIRAVQSCGEECSMCGIPRYPEENQRCFGIHSLIELPHSCIRHWREAAHDARAALVE